MKGRSRPGCVAARRHSDRAHKQPPLDLSSGPVGRCRRNSGQSLRGRPLRIAFACRRPSRRSTLLSLDFGGPESSSGAGYFLFSGIFGFGDGQEFIEGLPHQAAIRIAMTIFGGVLYVAVTGVLASAVKPFCADRRAYNTAGRLPYYAACLFSCAAGVRQFRSDGSSCWSQRLPRRSVDLRG